MPYVPYTQLTERQQKDARWLRPKWQDNEFARVQFWVKPDGALSRRNGHHTLTAEAGAEIDAMLKRDDVLTKGDLRGFKTADFSLTQN